MLLLTLLVTAGNPLTESQMNSSVSRRTTVMSAIKSPSGRVPEQFETITSTADADILVGPLDMRAIRRVMVAMMKP